MNKKFNIREWKDTMVQEGALNERDETDGALDKMFQILHKDLKYPLSKSGPIIKAIEKLLRKS